MAKKKEVSEIQKQEKGEKKPWDARSTPLWLSVKDLIVMLYRVTNDGFFDSEPVSRTNIRQLCLTLISNISQALDADTPSSSVYFLRIAIGTVVRLSGLMVIQFELGAVTQETYDKVEACLSDIKEQLNKLKGSLMKKRGKKSTKTKKQ